MADLKTNYVDDVLDTSVNVKRKYNMIQNADGTVSFDDVTTYTQNGDSFGAKDINDTNTAVNELNSNLNDTYTLKNLGYLGADGTPGAYYTNEIYDSKSTYICLGRQSNANDSMFITPIMMGYFNNGIVSLSNDRKIGLIFTGEWGVGYIFKLIKQ